jgi:pimeloyl-ACP methyl ester carboxylesterase
VPRPPLETADDVQLAGRRWLTSGPPRAGVVLVHGFTAGADDPAVSEVGDDLHGRGLDVVTYDARGHGRSGGESTLGDLERHDVAAAVAKARERTDRVVLVGASMGAIAVLRHAADDPDLAGVVSVSCPSRWRLPLHPLGLLSALMTRTPPGRWIARRFVGVRIAGRWNNPDAPAELVGRVRSPVAFVHGLADRFIRPGDARELHGRAATPRRLDLVEGMGHAFDPLGYASIGNAVEWSLLQAGR